MMTETMFFTLLGLNLLVIAAYCLVMVIRHFSGKTDLPLSTCFLRAGVMLLCPVLGVLYYLATYLLERVGWFREVDLSDVAFRKGQAHTFATADEERERDLAPIEETLKVGDKKNLRQLMLNVLRGDLEDSLGSITLALNSSDSETAHYAASVLRDELNNFRLRVQQINEEILQEPASEGTLEAYLVDYMGKVLAQGVFTNLEQEKYVRILDSTAEKLYQKDPAEITPLRGESVCELLLEIKAFDRVQLWCDRLAEQYPDTLTAYTCQLKLYFTTNDRERFFATMAALKQSDIVIDQETLEMIRVFQ